MTEMKHCRKCGCDKPADRDHWYFKKDKPSAPCRSCQCDKARERSLNSDVRRRARERVRERYHNDAEFKARHDERQRKYRSDPEIQVREREKSRERQRQRRTDPQAKARDAEYMRERRTDPEYKERERDYMREYFPQYKSARYRNDPKFNLDTRVGASLRHSLNSRDIKKLGSKSKFLDWTTGDLIRHFEPLFENDMGWHNMDLWEIDHIIPLSAVNYKSQNDPLFKMVWALDNLAPLWGADNYEKRAKTQWVLPDHYKNPRLRSLYENRDEFLLIFG